MARTKDAREFGRTGLHATVSLVEPTMLAKELAMTELAVSIPDNLFGSLRKAPHELAKELRIAAAIHWYQQGLISMGRAAETAGMDRPEFLAELARRKIDVFVIDEEDLERELKGV